MRITESQIRKIVRQIVTEQVEAPGLDAVGSSSEFYLLGYWSNAYSSRSEKEYFWSGPFDTRQEAVLFGKMKQQRGQPKKFYDWGKGQNKIFGNQDKFLAAAHQAGLNPRLNDEY